VAKHILGTNAKWLWQVLSPMLLEEELHAIFGRLAALYSKNLAEAFSRIEPQVTPSLFPWRGGGRGVPGVLTCHRNSGACHIKRTLLVLHRRLAEAYLCTER